MSLTRIQYTINTLNAFCYLIGSADEEETDAICRVIDKMLTKVWQVEHKSYGSNNQNEKAQKFWNKVCGKVDGAHAIIADYGYNLSPNASKVLITIHPKRLALKASFLVDATDPKEELKRIQEKAERRTNIWKKLDEKQSNKSSR